MHLNISMNFTWGEKKRPVSPALLPSPGRDQKPLEHQDQVVSWMKLSRPWVKHHKHFLWTSWWMNAMSLQVPTFHDDSVIKSQPYREILVAVLVSRMLKPQRRGHQNFIKWQLNSVSHPVWRRWCIKATSLQGRLFIAAASSSSLVCTSHTDSSWSHASHLG